MISSAANVTRDLAQLLAEIDDKIDTLNQTGSQAFAKGNHSAAQQLLKQISDLKALREETSGLYGNWQGISSRLGPLLSTVSSQSAPSILRERSRADNMRLDEATEKLVAHDIALRELLLQVYKEVLSICPDAVCKGNTKWINFRRRRNFLILVALSDHFDAGIAVGDNYRHPRLDLRRSKEGEAGWNGWPSEYQGIRIRSGSDLDQDFRMLLQHAASSYGGC